MSRAFEASPLPTEQKLNGFEKYVRRQQLSRFIARYEMFKLNLEVKGSVVECGVFEGAGVMAWAKLSAMLEPYALDRHIIGFDSFNGFPSIDEKDTEQARNNPELKTSGLPTGEGVYKDVLNCIDEFNENRFLNHLEKVKLVKGDAIQTIPEFIVTNPHLIVSLLFLDFDLYEPTKVALSHFLPRMPKGAILAFDEINNPWWPGETRALLEAMGHSLNEIEIKRFSFDPNIAYVQL
ncbi:MAG: hypothetical protein Alis3KO_21280 [Aliiglaciecola sp.]|uniref:TylF/MycF/NovP-related O-methyltransferase n=1 Tax=Aliiglaciecola sp. M165 TaxID=2593649 RepID=UPI00118042B7|nr:TylF/MycF/NovP-related O-methyltransferase [Aliiglaciecola sp. M165]TRY30945.1 class I SAM-dependent methyltransferase [Aliiglaciecola sp. M165]